MKKSFQNSEIRIAEIDPGSTFIGLCQQSAVCLPHDEEDVRTACLAQEIVHLNSHTRMVKRSGYFF